MKRKKRNLSALITAGLIMCASNSFSIKIVTKEYACPIGNEKFTAGISLPQQCPENKFVMFKENFTKEELKKYEKIINSKEYKAIPQNSPKEYYLGRFYEMAGGFLDKEIGETYYKSYIEHINKNIQNNDTLKESLKKALSYADKLEKMTDKSFKENIKMEMKNIKRNDYLEAAFLKAEAERRLGKFEEALKTLSKIDVADIKNTAFNSDFEKLKELIEKKDNSVSQYIPGRIMY